MVCYASLSIEGLEEDLFLWHSGEISIMTAAKKKENSTGRSRIVLKAQSYKELRPKK